MQRLAIGLLKPEMISAVDVAENNGRIMLRAGMPFQENHIQRVTKLGFGSAYVELPLCIAEPPAKILSRELHDSGVKIIRQIYEAFRDKGEADGSSIRELANRLVNEVIINRGHLVQWVDLRTPEDYLPAHALQVAVLSILIGLKMDYNPAKLLELTIGALMLDIGEMLIPPEILHKAEKLSPEEMEIIKKHSESGFEGLRKKIKGIPATSAHVAYQHHENYAGNGYPRGIGGSEIHEYARIASVADMFDALVSDRPFRRYYLPHEAAGILQALAGKLLDPEMVSALLHYVAIYPKGELVRLDTGEYGEVHSIEATAPSRPKLRLLTDKWGKPLRETDWADLGKQRSRYIDKVLKDNEVMEWITK